MTIKVIITYHGDNYFKVQSGSLTVLIDPTNGRSLRGAGLVVNTVKPPLVSPSSETQGCFWINHQGEYEIGGIHVRGWSTGNEKGKEKTVYRLVFDGIDLLLMGYLTQEPESEIQEYLGGADVVILPAGGKPFVPQSVSAKLIRQIEPSVVIPSLFKNVKPFLKEFNRSECIFGEKLVLKKKNLKPGAMEIRCLK